MKFTYTLFEAMLGLLLVLDSLGTSKIPSCYTDNSFRLLNTSPHLRGSINQQKL